MLLSGTILILLSAILLKDSRAHRLINNSDINNNRERCFYDNFNLTNYTSDVTIYVTTDMVLSSLTQLTHLKSITIIGYNYPTVQCDYSGGLHFVSCHNVTIEGITWNDCSANASVYTTPLTGLYMYNSSNIALQNCTFLNSLGQSIALSKVSGKL